jgi:hypothetical protein
MTNYDKSKWTTQPQKPKPQEKPTPEKINLNPLKWLNSNITKVIKKDGGNRDGN